MKLRGPHLGARTSGLAVVVVVAAMVAVPTSAVALTAFRLDGHWATDAFARVFGQSRTWRLVAVTVIQAGVSSLVTVIVGVGIAWVFARYSFRGRSALLSLATVPFVLPSVVIGASMGSIFGPRGIFDARGTWWLIIAAHLCFNLAVVVRTVGAAIGGFDPDQEAAARMLGAGRGGALRRVVLPSIAPAVASAGVVVFLFCLTSFGVIVILGGGSVTTMEVEIWTRATRLFDLPGAGVLSILQVLAVLATITLHARITRRSGGAQAVEPRPRHVPRTRGERLWVVLAGGGVIVVSGVPLMALVERSLRVAGGLGLDHWRNLGSVLRGSGLQTSPVGAMWNSLSTATIAAGLSILAAILATRAVARRPGGIGERVLLLPLGVSATTIGLGLLIAFGRPPLDLRRSIVLVPLAQMLVALPLVVRVLLPAVRSVPPSLDDAAMTLGAAPISRLLRVELPMIRSALAAAVGLGFVTCLGEFGATVFLSRSDRPTIPVAIARLMSRPGEAGFGQAMALSVIMALVSGVVLVVVERVASGRGGGSLVF